MLKIAPNLSLPVELSGRRTAVFGISGSGKSNTATVILEELAGAGEQFILIDHKGEGWGLLSLANGKPSNLDVIIFGEPGGHIKTLTEHDGPQIADFAVESGQSIVLSLTGFPSDAAERRFVTGFLRQLYRRKQSIEKRTRTLVVFEEAHLFVPEGVRGEAAELAGACQRIVRQGRSFGIGSLVVDQRPQDVAKRVLTQCDTIICHNLVHPLDKKALSEWMAANARGDQQGEFLESLPTLKDGEAWVWSPKLKIFKRVQVRRRKTFDSGSAPDDATAVKVQRKDVDIPALDKRLADMREKSKAEDPKELRKKIAQLEQQLKTAKTAPSGEVVKQVPSAVIERARQAGFNEAVKQSAAAIKERDQKIRLLQRTITNAAQALGADISKVIDFEPKNNFAPKLQTVAPTPVSRPPKKPSGENSRKYSENHTGELPRGEATILSACIQYPNGLRREQLTILTGYKRSSRDAYIQRARERGYVECRGDLIVATEAGIAALPNAEPLPTGAELQDFWRNRLPEGERKIFEIIIEAGGEVIEKDSLEELTGYKRSSRDAYLQRLRAKELIDEPTRGTVRAAETLLA